jgi:hypothetical protein
MNGLIHLFWLAGLFHPADGGAIGCYRDGPRIYLEQRSSFWLS